MAEEPKLIFEFNTGQNGGLKLAFNSIEEIESWLTGEEAFWKWLTDRPVREIYQKQIKNTVIGSLNNIKSSLANFRREVSQKTTNDLKNFFTEAFISRNIPLSVTPRAKFIIDLKDRDPDQAEFALCYFFYIDPRQTSPKVLQGYFSAFAFENNLKNTSENERVALENLLSDLTTKVSEANGALRQLKIDIGISNNEQMTRIEKNKSEFDALVETKKKSFEDLYKTTEKTLKNIERTYDEKLALQAAVKYWKLKADSHYRNSWIFGIMCLIVGLIFAYGIYAVIKELVGSDKIANVELWKLGVIAIESIFGVWLTRVFIRLFLSNMHLLTDSNERRVLLLTFLALLRKGDLKETDQKLILQSLFRPTSTGIIKDDAAPPFMAEWLKRAVGND